MRSHESRAYLAYLTEQQDAFEESTSKAVSGARITHRYQVVLGGVAMLVPESQLDRLSALPQVKAVYRDELRQIETERSPAFIRADSLWEQLGGQDSAGEGVIVAVLDTGVWPEHPSFADPDPSGKPYPEPAVIPGSNGFGPGGPRSTCDFGNTAANPADVPFICNGKLIGAYTFLDTYKATVGLLPEEFHSARDDIGHGTHTSSTATGNGGVPATLLGVDRGAVSGIAPRSHVMMYRVCASGGCFQSDTIAAVEQAILDGVDVINFSIGGGETPYSDPVSLAFLDAYAAGVFVAASAGNRGPDPDTVIHREPWIMTVGASTVDRDFLSTVTLLADNGSALTITGASVTDGIFVATPVVLASDFGDPLCRRPFTAGTFADEIVVCNQGVVAPVEKGHNLSAGEAGAMLLVNSVAQGLSSNNHFIPTVHLDSDAGSDLLEFMADNTGVMGTFTAGLATGVTGDVMAAFSSRGGTGETLGISKPDITAPGVQILAGNTPTAATDMNGQPGELFQSLQGTSMSTPHVAGAAALLKDLHPEWSPGQIKSALMTTAVTENILRENGETKGGAFEFGSGRIDMERAGAPGLTFDESGADYIALEDELWSANYPSLYVPVMPGRVTVQRTVASDLGERARWDLDVSSPSDVDIDVPGRIAVSAEGEATFEITIDARHVPLGEARHSTLALEPQQSDDDGVGLERLHLPITIVRNQPSVALESSCRPRTLSRDETTGCTITIANTGFDDAIVILTDELPRELELVEDSVVGAAADNNRVTFGGTVAGAKPPDVTVAAGASPFGYVSLAGLGAPPLRAFGDETILSFGVPPFEYAGETWTSIGMVSDGYAVVGGGTDSDVSAINQAFPDVAAPNNVLAPFWTDLDPAAGGALRAAIVIGAVDSWLVLDWDSVPNSGDGMPNSFQIWVGVNGVEDISYTYGPLLTAGNSGLLTVGAENRFGNHGDSIYTNGEGTLPTPFSSPVRVESTAGAPGETHVITFTAEGKRRGDWTNCAEMTADTIFGTNIACFSGEVTDDDDN